MPPILNRDLLLIAAVGYALVGGWDTLSIANRFYYFSMRSGPAHVKQRDHGKNTTFWIFKEMQASACETARQRQEHHLLEYAPESPRSKSVINKYLILSAFDTQKCESSDEASK